MIGVDTNVLVRVFVPDVPAQTARALDFFNDRTVDDPAYVSSVALIELVWVLKRAYGFPSLSIHTALNSLFESANISIERFELVRDAVAVAKAKNADIADCVISAIAREAGCVVTITFDVSASRRVPGMELLK